MALLRQRGQRVNRKKVQRLMREDNLLCLRKRRFVVTTASDHGFTLYPNLARDQVLTASISYGCPTSPASGWRRSSSIWR
ncbi:MAG: IS3 family transposase [Acidobacteriota bacterium]